MAKGLLGLEATTKKRAQYGQLDFTQGVIPWQLDGFSRASSGTYFDRNGVMQIASNDVPRLDYGLVTNLVSNSTMFGATIGIIGSGGSLPTGWSVPGHAGLQYEIVDIGTQYGLEYIDLKISGTPNATSGYISTDATVTSIGGTYCTASSYAAIIGGATTNFASINVRVQFDVGTTSTSTNMIPTLTSKLRRYQAIAAISLNGGVDARITYGLTIGQAVNVTLRIAGVQLEYAKAANEYVPSNGVPGSAWKPRGMLVEANATNLIRNSTMVGGVSGTPGTLPTNWGSGIRGLTMELTYNTISGINCVDIHISGTPTSSGECYVNMDGNSNIGASSGQTRCISANLALIAGSFANTTSNYLSLNTFNSGSFVSAAINKDISTLNSSFKRWSGSATLSGTISHIQPLIKFSVTNGIAVDFTIRLGCPQVEGTLFPTSFIPTTTTSATRSLEIPSINNMYSVGFNANESSFIIDFEFSAVSAELTSTTARLFSLQNTLDSAEYVIINKEPGGANFRAQVATLGSVFASNYAGATTLASKMSFSFKTNSCEFINRGSILSWGANQPTSMPIGINRILVGSSATGLFSLNGWVRKFEIYPFQQTTAYLQEQTVTVV